MFAMPKPLLPSPSSPIIDAEPLLDAVRRHVKLPRAALQALREEFERLLSAQLVRPAAPSVKSAAGRSPAGDDVLTTQEAADLLGVSRPYLAAQIDAGEIPLHHRVGNQRRVLKSEVLAWHKRAQRRQRRAMKALWDSLSDEIERY